MGRTSINVLRAVGWLALGLGVGSGGTFVLQRWASTSAPIPNARAENQPPLQAALVTELMLQGEPTLGSSKAPLTIVEFSDFQCPYCRQFHEQVLPPLKQEYINKGLVRFIHKDLPLPFHSQAKPAAAAARCAGEQNRYWDLYGALFDQQTCLDCKGVVRIAEELTLDISALQACMQKEPKFSSQPIFLKPNCTTSAPLRLSSSGPAAPMRNIGATSSKVLCPGLNSKP